MYFPLFTKLPIKINRNFTVTHVLATIVTQSSLSPTRRTRASVWFAMADNARKEDEGTKEQKVDPWTVQAAEGEATINYEKLIGRF